MRFSTLKNVKNEDSILKNKVSFDNLKYFDVNHAFQCSKFGSRSIGHNSSKFQKVFIGIQLVNMTQCGDVEISLSSWYFMQNFCEINVFTKYPVNC